MTKKDVFLFLIVFFFLFTANIKNLYSKSIYEIYIITIGSGDDIYTKWGHNAIRVRNTKTHEDLAYNYGTFNFTPLFARDFIKGKLIYYLSVSHYKQMLAYYRFKNRSIFSQRLNLSKEQSKELASLLKENAKPTNRDYVYNHQTNNCSTKVRDLLNKITNNDIKKQSKTISNRSTRYYYNPIKDNYALFFLFDFLTNEQMDKKLSHYEEMFIPDRLREYILEMKLTKSIKVGDDVFIEERKPLVINEELIYKRKDKSSLLAYLSIPYLPGYLFIVIILWGIVYPIFSLRKGKIHNFKISFSLVFLGLIYALLSALLLYMAYNAEGVPKIYKDNESHYAIFLSDFLLVVAGFLFKIPRLRLMLLWFWSYTKLSCIFIWFTLYFLGVFKEDKLNVFIITAFIAILITILTKRLSILYKKA